MGATFIPNRSLGFMPDEYLFRADWPHRWRSRSGLRRDRDVDKMPNVTQGESRESLLAMPSPSNVMEHKEMLIWHKETLKSEKGYKIRPNDRFGFISVRRLPLRAEVTFLFCEGLHHLTSTFRYCRIFVPNATLCALRARCYVVLSFIVFRYVSLIFPFLRRKTMGKRSNNERINDDA